MPMAREPFADQVRLLVRTLPHIAGVPGFALKGGTAINLFYRDMPRLSVDIDLTFLSAEPYDTASIAGDAALRVSRMQGGGANETRLLVQSGKARIKVETSPSGRGTVRPPEMRSVTPAVEDEFGFAEILTVAFEDLYGGKLVAALDRQHPRDLFDVKLLYENEGLTDDLFRVFLVYVACSGRPPHEILAPNMLDISQAYDRQFVGMTVEPVTLNTLFETRARLVADVGARLDGNAKRFLLSLLDGQPDFDAIGLPEAAVLPAIAWKVLNIGRLKLANPEKYAAQRKSLEDVF
jgi:hypothetical protein